MVLGWGGSWPTLDAHSLKEHSRKSCVNILFFLLPSRCSMLVQYQIFCKQNRNLREITAQVLRIFSFFYLLANLQSLNITKSAPQGGSVFKMNRGSVEAAIGGFFNKQLCNAYQRIAIIINSNSVIIRAVY